MLISALVTEVMFVGIRRIASQVRGSQRTKRLIGEKSERGPENS